MRRALTSLTVAACLGLLAPAGRAADSVDFNREVRPILANNCYRCHGPDTKERKASLRLDTEEGSRADLGGTRAVVPGKPEESELIRRITATEPGEVMPPRKSGKRLTAHEIDVLTRWVRQGGRYAKHWAYAGPVRPPLPAVKDRSWPRNGLDYFILARLEKEGLKPSPEADRYALVRRVALDLTGLPPAPEEVERFVKDPSSDAYEKLVDRLLESPAYGEHWARMWLDLARYADSAGYADDPPRTIWAFRDYVIRSFNANKPFDQFTIEQIAGDLLPGATPEQLIATAFHRNTMTNNEGGTNDEEFRNVAVVDRVNTTLAVWMGTSMACAQCHNHKYDPISQEEYFRFFALLNNTEDADRGDESPRLSLFTEEQKRQKQQWETEIASLEKAIRTPTPALRAAQARWEKDFPHEVPWQVLKPAALKARNGTVLSQREDGSILARRGPKSDAYTLEIPLDGKRLTALRLEALPDDSLPGKGPGHSAAGNFILSRVQATVTPPGAKRPAGRFVRVEIPGKQKILSLAEVEVFSGSDNIARKGTATQSSTAFDGPARLAIDGNTNGDYNRAKSTTHTAVSDNPWWEVDLKTAQPIDRIAIWNRTDGGLHTRLNNFRVAVLDEKRQTIWEQTIKDAPNPSVQLQPSGARPVVFSGAYADHSQPGFEPASVLDGKGTPKGWAVGSRAGKPSVLLLVPAAPLDAPAGSVLTLTLEQLSANEYHTLGHFRIGGTSHERAAEHARTPENIRALLKLAADRRSPEQAAALENHYLGIAPELQASRDRLASLRKQLAEMKPATTVPIMRELTGTARRKTRIQHRGNFLDLGPEVKEGMPAAFNPLPPGTPPNRLTLARWLVSEDNPLTARVMANRFWEQVFGTGLVRTSEEFGTQGELPSHPELLDWLATEFVRQKWDMKAFLKLLVTSAAYRQTSRVTSELLERDPDNRLLARGPRFRLSAEVLRDQALAVAGLLSVKMYGPPVRPPRPVSGLAAAFGGTIDWQTSAGEDRYRRGLYTEWRRSNPYPSMVTFDAPNREVCTLRRTRTNTPLQALVTLNDPVYVEAAQALARRLAATTGGPADKIAQGFRRCVARPPSERESSRLVKLYQEARADFARSLENARHIAGTSPAGADVADLAAWTVVANVLLNLDEMFMKR
jgi:mono/diheme cytochrome c family protein